jgi:beta-glucanase (GH16 family)
MNACRTSTIAILLTLSIPLAPSAGADERTKDLLELGREIGKRSSPQYGSDEQVKAMVSHDPAAPGLVVAIRAGKAAYPGVNIKPAGTRTWDLSKFGHVEARVVNTGSRTMPVALRVDNGGDWRDAPWNTEQVFLKPGETATVKVIFGFQYGHKPGFALKPAEVVNIVLFTDKADAAKSFRIESLVAAGTKGERPPVDPSSIRIKPANSVLFGPGGESDANLQILANGTKAWLLGRSVRIIFPEVKGGQSVELRPVVGRWDLRNATEVRVGMRNPGRTPIALRLELLSNGGPSDTVEAVLAAGEEKEVAVSFLAAVPGRGVPVAKAGYFGNQPGTGTTFTSDAMAAVKITADHDGEATLVVESIMAATPAARLPDWLGKRPPVPGDWIKTLDEEFDGTAVDQQKWNIYGPNYWDRASHWSKDNLIVRGGVAKFHFEKKHGFHNDNSDPKVDPQNLTGRKDSDYACGYLDSFGKWKQRYGYFEARAKLPRAAGLWPTFWMMPDRGAAAPPGTRSDTGSGGMEFDIMEHLTRWGPYRYNIALHFDGYGPEHKSVGSACNYVQADKDGFITPGLLWTPGSAVFYCNGRELWRWDDSRVSRVPSYFIFEVTTGGWDNDPVNDKQLPADYVVDYVRAWQRKDLVPDADGCTKERKAERK